MSSAESAGGSDVERRPRVRSAWASGDYCGRDEPAKQVALVRVVAGKKLFFRAVPWPEEVALDERLQLSPHVERPHRSVQTEIIRHDIDRRRESGTARCASGPQIDDRDTFGINR